MSRALRYGLGLLLAALLFPAAASAYSWPIRPFYQPHAIRGYFDDPRLSGDGTGFHFGVDISAPDGTPVYAIEPGRARVHGLAVSVLPKRGGHLLSYWHVVPEVLTNQRVRRHQLIGEIEKGAGHVHLAERKGGNYVNPLRLGGLAPYVDDTAPILRKTTFYSAGNAIPAASVRGTVDLTVDADDPEPFPLPPLEWSHATLAPSLIRWRVVQGPTTIRRWETAVDFRAIVLPLSLFPHIYAPGTRQNRPFRPGRYEFYLAHELDTRAWPNGAYVLQVEALDEQENKGEAWFPFTVGN